MHTTSSVINGANGRRAIGQRSPHPRRTQASARAIGSGIRSAETGVADFVHSLPLGIAARGFRSGRRSRDRPTTVPMCTAWPTVGSTHLGERSAQVESVSVAWPRAASTCRGGPGPVCVRARRHCHACLAQRWSRRLTHPALPPVPPESRLTLTNWLNTEWSRTRFSAALFRTSPLIRCALSMGKTRAGKSVLPKTGQATSCRRN